MTISDPDIIREMLENNGVFPGDPPAVRIYKYTRKLSVDWFNSEELETQIVFAVFYRKDDDDLASMGNIWVSQPVLLFEDGVVTPAGKGWLIRLDFACQKN